PLLCCNAVAPPTAYLYPLAAAHRHLHSSPTRRSSDLATIYATGVNPGLADVIALVASSGCSHIDKITVLESCDATAYDSADIWTDRKSTRLNSSHVSIAYAVFCLTNNNTLFPSSEYYT